MDVDPAAELLVEVLHTVEIFGVSLHINVAPHKLGLVSDEPLSTFPGLYKHLVRERLRAARHCAAAVFGRHRHLICQQVDHA